MTTQPISTALTKDESSLAVKIAQPPQNAYAQYTPSYKLIKASGECTLVHSHTLLSSVSHPHHYPLILLQTHLFVLSYPAEFMTMGSKSAESLLQLSRLTLLDGLH